MRAKFIKEVAIVGGVLFLLHIAASTLYFYWDYWWFDLVMHFTGGFWVSLMLLWFFYHSGYVTAPERSLGSLLLVGVALTVVFGLAWEVYEFLFGVIVSPEGYFIDTATDLMMDVAGSLLGVLYFLKRKY